MKIYARCAWVGLAMALAGCASQNSGIHSLSQSDAQRLNAQHSPFDTTADPPLTADTHFAAGQLAEAEHANDVAIKQYEEALHLDSKHLPSLYRLAVLYTQMKTYPKALDTWHRYVKATGDSASAYGNLGFCLELAGEPIKAETAYQTGISKDAKNLQCRTNYGLMLARHDRIPEAVRIWQPVLSEAEIHYNLASIYEIDHRTLEARAEYKEALAADPQFSDAKERLSALDLSH